MANTIIGRIFKIGAIESFPSKNGGEPFQKRTLIMDCSRFDQFSGKKYDNFPQLEFAGRNVTLLDGFQEGDLVEVSFALNGRSYEKDGETRYFTSIVGYKVEHCGVANGSQTPSTAQPMAYQAPQPAPQMAPTVQPAQQVDDLPF